MIKMEIVKQLIGQGVISATERFGSPKGMLIFLIIGGTLELIFLAYDRIKKHKRE